MNKTEEQGKAFKLRKIIFIVFFTLIICEVIFSITIGIIGIVSFKKYGFYPETIEAFKFLGSAGGDRAESSTSFNFMFELCGGNAIIFVISTVAAVVIQYMAGLVRALISTLSIAAYIAIVAVLVSKEELLAMASTWLGLWIFLASIALLVILFFCLISSNYSIRLFVGSFLALLFHVLVMPLIMWLICMSVNELMYGLACTLLLGALIFVIFIMPNLSFDRREKEPKGRSGGVSPAIPNFGFGKNKDKKAADSGVSDDRETKKIKDEIAFLERRIKDSKHGIEEHRKKSFGYFHVDENVTQRQIDSDKERIKVLEDRLKRK